jgi:methionine sulfoxide reductase heme-binding subunit
MQARINAILASKWTKVVVFACCLLPLLFLGLRVLQNDLTANPVQFVEHWMGDWTLRFLIVTLCVTPLRKAPGFSSVIRYRRMLGLFAFFYACLHFLSYMVLDEFFDFHAIWKDIYKRPYITVGFTAFVLLIPLAVTSTTGWIRRLGGRRWQMLHRAIYISAVLGVIHYYWLVKSDVRKPLQYAFIVGLLLAWRIGAWAIKRGKQPVRSMRREEPSTAETA